MSLIWTYVTRFLRYFYLNLDYHRSRIMRKAMPCCPNIALVSSRNTDSWFSLGLKASSFQAQGSSLLSLRLPVRVTWKLWFVMSLTLSKLHFTTTNCLISSLEWMLFDLVFGPWLNPYWTDFKLCSSDRHWTECLFVCWFSLQHPSWAPRKSLSSMSMLDAEWLSITCAFLQLWELFEAIARIVDTGGYEIWNLSWYK